METAKDILYKYNKTGAVNIIPEAALAAMREIAELAYCEGWSDRDSEDQQRMPTVNKKYLQITIAELFPGN